METKLEEKVTKSPPTFSETLVLNQKSKVADIFYFAGKYKGQFW